MKALLLSAYDAGSHKAWRVSLCERMPEITWQVETLPARHFAWRSRSNSLEFALALKGQHFDLLLATSPTDLSALLGMCPSLLSARKVLYMHENQFAYPMTRHAAPNAIHLQLLNLYAVLAADVVLWNSAYNLESFLEGLKGLLEAMPDGPGFEALWPQILSASTVLPVGIDPALFDTEARLPTSEQIHLLWPHRWEYDKAPERFFAALHMLHERSPDLPLRLHVLGHQFRQAPACFAKAKQALAPWIETWGHLPHQDDYRRILRRSNLVVSSALHDFQGLAMLEAIACGCTPVAPDRLAYKEYVPDSLRFASTPSHPEAESTALAAMIEHLVREPSGLLSHAKASALAAPYAWDTLLPRYITCLTPEGFP